MHSLSMRRSGGGVGWGEKTTEATLLPCSLPMFYLDGKGIRRVKNIFNPRDRLHISNPPTPKLLEG